MNCGGSESHVSATRSSWRRVVKALVVSAIIVLLAVCAYCLAVQHYPRLSLRLLPQPWDLLSRFDEIAAIILLLPALVVVLAHEWLYRQLSRAARTPFTVFSFGHGVVLVAVVSGLMTLLVAGWVCTGTPLNWGLYLFLLLGFWCLVGSFTSGRVSNTPRRLKQDANSGLLIDAPIRFASEDLFGRGDFVDELEERITSAEHPSSLVVGVDGSYGEGKTSVLNLLSERVQGQKNVVVVRLNPWLFGDQEAALAGFFASVNDALSDRFLLGYFGRSIARYAAVLSPAGHRLGLDITAVVKDKPASQLKEEIARYINDLDVRVVVFVDDVDRMESADLRALLKLLRLCADFPRTVYVLAYDERAAVFGFEGSEEGAAMHKLLEKVVQVPLRLPEVEQEQLDEFLQRALKAELDAADWVLPEEKHDFDSRWWQAYREYGRNILRTLRQIKRLLSVFTIRFRRLGPEINATDLLLLEVIRLTYPVVYEHINQHLELYVEKSLYLLTSLVRDDKEDRVLRQFLDKQPQSEILWGILAAMFNHVGEVEEGVSRRVDENAHLRLKRIDLYQNTGAYFLARPAGGLLPKKEFQELLALLQSKSSPQAVATEVHARIPGYVNANHIVSLLDLVSASLHELDACVKEGIARGLAASSHLFPYSSDPLDITSRAVHTSIRLVAGCEGQESLLAELVASARSDYYSFVLTVNCRPRHNPLLPAWTEEHYEKVAAAFDARLQRVLAERQVNVFREREHPMPLLDVWKDCQGEDDHVGVYLRDLFSREPAAAAQFLRALVVVHSTSSGEEVERKFYYHACVKLFAPAELLEVLEGLDVDSLNELQRWALDQLRTKLEEAPEPPGSS